MKKEPKTKIFGFELFTNTSDWFPSPDDQVLIVEGDGTMTRGVFTHFVYNTFWFKMDSNACYGLPIPSSLEGLIKQGIPKEFAEAVLSRAKLIYVKRRKRGEAF